MRTHRQARTRRLAGPLLTVAVALASASGCGGGEELVVERPAPATAPEATTPEGTGSPASRIPPGQAEDMVVVDVGGAVRRPGVYRLPYGSRVHDAIGLAGGVLPGAGLSTLNRAAILVDGQHVVVPPAANEGAPGPPGAGSGPGAATVSLSTADAADLEELPGIGPVTAEAIVADRAESGPFTSLADLERVSGVGPATVARLEGLATP